MAQAITRSGHEDVEPRRVPMREYPAEPGNHQGDHHVESPHGAQRQHQAHGEAKQETSHHGGAQAVMGPHFAEELHTVFEEGDAEELEGREGGDRDPKREEDRRPPARDTGLPPNFVCICLNKVLCRTTKIQVDTGSAIPEPPTTSSA